MTQARLNTEGSLGGTSGLRLHDHPRRSGPDRAQSV